MRPGDARAARQRSQQLADAFPSAAGAAAAAAAAAGGEGEELPPAAPHAVGAPVPAQAPAARCGPLCAKLETPEQAMDAGGEPAAAGPAGPSPAAEPAAASVQAALDAAAAGPSPFRAAAATAAAAAAAAACAPARRRAASPPQGPAGPAPPPASPGAAWNAAEDSALQQGVQMFGRDPCKVAVLVGSKSCAQVAARLGALLPAAAAAAGGGAGPADPGGLPPRKRRRFGRKAKAPVLQKRSAPAVAYERHRRAADDMWSQYAPCACPGPCRESCPCRGDTNFCEKFCACDPAK
jgi:hypothetical protein